MLLEPRKRHPWQRWDSTTKILFACDHCGNRFARKRSSRVLNHQYCSRVCCVAGAKKEKPLCPTTAKSTTAGVRTPAQEKP